MNRFFAILSKAQKKLIRNSIKSKNFSFFSTIKQNSNEKPKENEGFAKYEELCKKQKEKIKNFEKKSGSQQYFSTQTTRLIFLMFFALINFYIMSQIYKILLNFYSPYKNSPKTSSIQELEEKNT